MSDTCPLEVIAAALDASFRKKHGGIDPIIVSAHRDTARLAVRTLRASGYALVLPDHELEDGSDGSQPTQPAMADAVGSYPSRTENAE